MRIACIRKIYDPAGGGAEKYAANFAAKMIDRGHELTMFSEKFRADQSESLKWLPVPRSNLPVLCRTLSFHKNVTKILKPSEFDLVYAMSRFYPADLFRVAEQLHAEWMPIRYSPLQRLNPRHRKILDMEKRVFTAENTKIVITNSDLTRNQIIERFKYPADRIKTVRNGIDRNKFFPAKTPDEKNALRDELGLGDKKVLLFVAGNFRIKGLNQALEAISNLDKATRKETLLLIIGGDRPASYIKLAKKMEIESLLRFEGKQSDLRKYYVASDLLFYPSLYEPFANVCLESCACSLPVLTTAKNGASELIKHGENGFVADSADNIDALTDALMEFLSFSKETLAKFAEAAFKATEDYSWDKHADIMESILTDVARKAPK